MGAIGRRARWVSCIVAVVSALGAPGRGAADEEPGRGRPGDANQFSVSILTPAPTKVCLSTSRSFDVGVMYLPSDVDDALAPLTPPDVVLTASAWGTATPETTTVGPFRWYGQIRVVAIRYKATELGREDLKIAGSMPNSAPWTDTVSFDVVRCKAVVVGTADMSPATNAANAAAGGMWTMSASLDLDAEVPLDEGAAAGTGTVAFSLTGDWTAGVDVFACQLDPPWSGAGTVDVQFDTDQLGSGVVDATLAIGAIQVNATTVTCGGDTGAGGIGLSVDVPPWQVPAATLDLDPVASPGGTDVQDFPYDVYQLPMTVSVVERPA